MVAANKNIVIVGAVAGHWLAQDLKDKLPQDYRIIYIDKQEHIFYPIAALRASVVPGIEEKVHCAIDQYFEKGSKHIVLPYTTVVELRERSVIVDKEHSQLGLGSEIHFEYCILATGASQAPPARPAGPTGKEIGGYFRHLQSTVASATGVLVVGGGPAGIEFATDVKEHHPNVNVTIVQRSDKLVRYAPRVHEKIMPILKAQGVEVILEDTMVWPEGYEAGETLGDKHVFHTAKGRTIEAQYVYQATGNIANSGLVESIDPSAIAKNGCIKVSTTFKVESTDPRLARVFAIGDVADVPEIKLLGGARRHARTCAANVLSLIAGKEMRKHHTPRPAASYITLGAHNAILYAPWFTLTGRWISKLLPEYLRASYWQREWRGAGGKKASS